MKADSAKQRTPRVRLAVYLVLVIGFLSQAPSQSLNENCTISVLNRNSSVRPDGTWRIDNVPSGFGPVRATATCVNNGATQIGHTGTVIIQPSITNGFDATIALGAPRLIPELLTLTSASTSLSGPGATAQLAVTARYPGGTTADVTAATSGTTYTASNPVIATVSPDGLVTAVATGTVLIGAINEGTPGIIQLSIAATSGDSDSDGLPDSFELQNGLNPNNPVDASEDADNDGLTNVPFQFIPLGSKLGLDFCRDPMDPGEVGTISKCYDIRNLSYESGRLAIRLRSVTSKEATVYLDSELKVLEVIRSVR